MENTPRYQFAQVMPFLFLLAASLFGGSGFMVAAGWIAFGILAGTALFMGVVGLAITGIQAIAALPDAIQQWKEDRAKFLFHNRLKAGLPV